LRYAQLKRGGMLLMALVYAFCDAAEMLCAVSN
jgi:hypothetical protein